MMRAGILRPRGAWHAELNPTKREGYSGSDSPRVPAFVWGNIIIIVFRFHGTVAVSAAHEQGRCGGHGASLPNPS